jgi:hypothetical protein
MFASLLAAVDEMLASCPARIFSVQTSLQRRPEPSLGYPTDSLIIDESLEAGGQGAPRRPTRFFVPSLHLVVQQVDFPLQLGLAAGLNQRLTSLNLQLGDLGAQTKTFDVEGVASQRAA